MTYCPMMEEQLLLVGSNIANVVYVCYFTLTSGDSAIIFVDSCDSIQTKVRILIVLSLLSYAEDRPALFHTRRGCLVCWGVVVGFIRFQKIVS